MSFTDIKNLSGETSSTDDDLIDDIIYEINRTKFQDRVSESEDSKHESQTRKTRKTKESVGIFDNLKNIMIISGIIVLLTSPFLTSKIATHIPMFIGDSSRSTAIRVVFGISIYLGINYFL